MKHLDYTPKYVGKIIKENKLNGVITKKGKEKKRKEC